jgi:predicted ester cyclase
MSANDVLRLHEQVTESWNLHDPRKFASYIDESVVWNDTATPEPIRGKAGAEEFLNKWITAFPDFKMKTISTVIADDRIAAELEFSGTNTGPLKVGDQPEIPATNKKVVNRGCVFGKVRNGKFIEIKSYPDLAGMMMQLGLFEMHEAHA